MIKRGQVQLSDGCRIAWRSDGRPDAPPLLLSNSLGANMAMWGDQVIELAAHFRVIRYDQRGHGASDTPSSEASIERLGGDAIELLDALKIKRAHFCGVSLGGMTGQWLGANAPARFDRMIFSCTSPYMGPPAAWQERIDTVLSKGMNDIAEAVVSRWVTLAYTKEHRARFAALRAMVAATDPAGYAACCAAIRDMDLRASAETISRPVLVICGKDDPATPRAMGEALAAAIPGAQLHILPGAHLTNIENARAFNALLLQFLSGAA